MRVVGDFGRHGRALSEYVILKTPPLTESLVAVSTYGHAVFAVRHEVFLSPNNRPVEGSGNQATLMRFSTVYTHGALVAIIYSTLGAWVATALARHQGCVLKESFGLSEIAPDLHLPSKLLRFTRISVVPTLQFFQSILD